jgi:hypothetical protein
MPIRALLSPNQGRGRSASGKLNVRRSARVSGRSSENGFIEEIRRVLLNIGGQSKTIPAQDFGFLTSKNPGELVRGECPSSYERITVIFDSRIERQEIQALPDGLDWPLS